MLLREHYGVLSGAESLDRLRNTNQRGQVTENVLRPSSVVADCPELSSAERLRYSVEGLHPDRRFVYVARPGTISEAIKLARDLWADVESDKVDRAAPPRGAEMPPNGTCSPHPGCRRQHNRGSVRHPRTPAMALWGGEPTVSFRRVQDEGECETGSLDSKETCQESMLQEVEPTGTWRRGGSREGPTKTGHSGELPYGSHRGARGKKEGN